MNFEENNCGGCSTQIEKISGLKSKEGRNYTKGSTPSPPPKWSPFTSQQSLSQHICHTHTSVYRVWNLTTALFKKLQWKYEYKFLFVKKTCWNLTQTYSLQQWLTKDGRHWHSWTKSIAWNDCHGVYFTRRNILQCKCGSIHHLVHHDCTISRTGGDLVSCSFREAIFNLTREGNHMVGKWKQYSISIPFNHTRTCIRSLRSQNNIQCNSQYTGKLNDSAHVLYMYWLTKIL